MRPISLEPGVAKYAEGSCLAKFGDTQVLRFIYDNKVKGLLRFCAIVLGGSGEHSGLRLETA